ncbi:thioredoxin family protein [Pseudotenacibaculum sp. MALMAid0570]|uniref:thioredoxin family protein n=1 Tax=Pseudotenacibaculum sp. MALMAid0570 TaxID=3143938 RepID=UPI0032DF3CB9
MALTPSNPFERGTLAPNFKLPDTISGKVISLTEIKGEKATVVMFICNHCPFVIHVNEQLVALANDYNSKGVGFVAISSNDVESYPQDSPENMKIHAKKLGYPFPYLYDESQEIAKAYDAACTPDLYVFDSGLKSVYHGQLDDSRPGNGIPVSGKSIRSVLNEVLDNKNYTGPEKPSIGCSIKWK